MKETYEEVVYRVKSTIEFERDYNNIMESIRGDISDIFTDSPAFVDYDSDH